MTPQYYARWCITRCPMTNAEITAFWFMYGFNPSKNVWKFYRFVNGG